ncbi:MAG TPA: adenylyltransferase/cytidyltransferase family protein [Candidatus Binatia bacterium]|nr:adenylyltransferase/cytidyltransferase family protein [Candidatus Binatia bacterium]
MGKLVSAEELSRLAADLKKQGKRIVTTNGVFDILHVGHAQMLSETKARGDVLIVGINSDASAKQNKGDKRPVNNEKDRAGLLCALSCVDYVYIFPEKGADRFIELVKPNIHTKAGQYTMEQVMAKEGSVVVKHGGKVELVQFLPGYSSTTAIERVLEAYRP